MAIVKNSIVRHKGTKEVYEVQGVYGLIALCLPINAPRTMGSIDKVVPFKIEELDLIMNEDSVAFNILFKDDTNGEGS